MKRKGRYVVKRIENIENGCRKPRISYDVYFEMGDKKFMGYEFIAEFWCKSDAVKFKKLKNNELLEKSLYRFNNLK